MPRTVCSIRRFPIGGIQWNGNIKKARFLPSSYASLGIPFRLIPFFFFSQWLGRDSCLVVAVTHCLACFPVQHFPRECSADLMKGGLVIRTRLVVCTICVTDAGGRAGRSKPPHHETHAYCRQYLVKPTPKLPWLPWLPYKANQLFFPQGNVHHGGTEYFPSVRTGASKIDSEQQHG